MTPSAITAAGLVLDIGGALMLAAGLAFRRPEVAVDEASTMIECNPAEDIGHATQTADAQVGATVLVLGFVLQLDSTIGRNSDWGWIGFVLAIAIAAAVDIAAWLFLRHYWRYEKLRDLLVHRFRRMDVSSWWPIWKTYGDFLGISWERFDDRPIAEYMESVIGSKRWLEVKKDRELPDVYTKPHSDLPGTPEYERAHGSGST